MSRLYVANITRQPRVVYYRLDFAPEGQPAKFSPPRQQEIPPGRQVQLGGDMHVSQIEDIVQQLSKYGMVAVMDVPRLKTKAPMVFNVDKPVPPEIMRSIQHSNSEIMIDEGRIRRQRAAIAVNDLIQQKVTNELMNNGIDDQATDNIGIAFEQLDQSEAGEKRIEEGYRVGAKGTQQQSRPKPAGKPGKAAPRKRNR